MTLPPTSYAPVDSRMIGGFCGLRPSSAKAVWLSPAKNNAAANGCNCLRRFMVSSAPARAAFLRSLPLSLLAGVLRGRLAHRKIQEPRGVVADELPDRRP